jgi:hypothetical protein
MEGGDFVLEKKTFIYLIFFMFGSMISIVVIETLELSMNYAWIPFLCSFVITTIAIVYIVEDVRLHEVVLAAVSSIILSFMVGIFGAISGALLFFQGISISIGYAATSVAGLATALGIAGAAAVPAVVIAAAVADPQAAALAAAPRQQGMIASMLDSPASRIARGQSLWALPGVVPRGPNPRQADRGPELRGGGRRKRGGVRWIW